MKIIADLHTHTNVSQHAVSTIEEMIAGAKRANLLAIAFTNHGSDSKDGATKSHFKMYSYLPKEIDGITVIGGAEANLRIDGTIDIDSSLSHLIYVIASIHDETFKSTNQEVIENAYLQALKIPYLNTLGHIGNPKYKFDYEKVISKCNEFGKIIEINNGTFSSRKGSYENCVEITRLCKKYEVPIAITSDAHISYAVGKFDTVLEIVKQNEYPKELIINHSKENLKNYFLKYRGVDIFNR